MCKSCGVAYSFVFGVQFHKEDCSEVKENKKERKDKNESSS